MNICSKNKQVEVILFNKPYNVLCQFTDTANRPTLANYMDINNFYACGRLDRDSEGLVVLSANGRLQHLISHPNFGLEKTYWVQVEGCPSESILDQLRSGIELKDGVTKPCRVALLTAPDIAPRVPDIRVRKNIPTCWLEISIREGRNRQVRRMTAAIGFPTLRLIRQRIGPWSLKNLPTGEYQRLTIPFTALPQDWRDYLSRDTRKQAPRRARQTAQGRHQTAARTRVLRK